LPGRIDLAFGICSEDIKIDKIDRRIILNLKSRQA